MKLAIRYSATYQYAEAASFSPHLVRLFPRTDIDISIDRIDFATDSSASVQYRQDLFDNLVANCFYPHDLDRLDYQLEIDLSIRPKNAFGFLLENHALQLPFTYKSEEAAILAPYMARGQTSVQLPPALERSTNQGATVDALVALNGWLHENIEYERREEGAPYTPEETLKLMRGSCRDYAVLLVEVLRHHGLASRLVSGYLWEDDSPESPRRAENALHAWVQVYLPGAGWLGLDPTNGVLCDHHFLATAVGLIPSDISPVHGQYYGKKTISSTLETSLSITEIS